MGSHKATAAAFATDIGVPRPSERLLGLLRQHDRLLADVARKRKALLRAEDEVGQVASEVARRLQPIMEESRRIDAELHRLFAEILGRRSLSKRAWRAVRQVYQQLQNDGVLSAGPRHRGAAAAPDLDEDADDDTFEGHGGHRAPNATDEVPTAAPAAANPTLRGLFLRLARALHPDRVQDGLEKAARTETMKEINRAYRDGDVARLAELERKLKAKDGFAGQGPGHGAGPSDGGVSDGDELDRKCAALEQTNEALRQQLKKLRRALRELRDSDMGRMAAEIERRRQRGGKRDPFADLDADAAADIERVRRLRDHVKAFRDGAISLEALLMGPTDQDDDDLDLELEDLLMPSRHRPARATGHRGRR